MALLLLVLAPTAGAGDEEPDIMQPLLAQDVTLNNGVTPFAPQWQHGPGGRTLTFGFGIEKILSSRLDAEVDSGWTFESPKGESRKTYPSDVSMMLHYVFLTIPEFQLTLIPNLSLATSGEASSRTSWGSAIAWGGRLAALPDRWDLGWLRAVEVHGDFGYSSNIGNIGDPELYFDPVLDYSLPYLTYITDQPMPWPLGHLCFFSEFNFDQVLAGDQRGAATMFVTPGVTYLSKIMQISVGTQLPINHPAAHSESVGLIGKLTFFVDAIDPRFGWKPF
jgi:hypothetical protein